MIGLIATTVLFLVLGILFINVKASFLIAGYNTMSPEQQARYDIAALSKFLGKIMLGIAGSTVLLLLGITLDSNGFTIAGVALILALSLFSLIRTNTGDRFQQEPQATKPH